LARFLALDWDHNQVHVVAADVSGGSIRVRNVLVWRESQSPNPAEAKALGQALRERLKAAGIAPAPVLACVGRDRVILKDIRYPPVAAADEHNVVRIQASKDLTDPPDEVVIDYTPLASSPGGERRALALIVRKELLSAYQDLCQGAGLRLAGLTPRPFGIAACVRRMADSPHLPAPAEPDGATAVLTVAEHWADFSIVRGPHLVYSRSLTAGPGLAGEVRRNLAVYGGQNPQAPVATVFLAGGGEEHAELHSRLQDTLEIPVHFFDPFALVDRPDLPATGRGGFTGAVGLLYAQASAGGLPINFARVKKAEKAKSPHRRLAVLAGGLVAVLALAGGAFWYLRQSDMDKKITALTKDKAEADALLAKLGEDGKRYDAVNTWVEGEVVWLDELYDLSDRLPQNNALRVTVVNGEQLARNAKSKQVAKMTIKGIIGDNTKPVDDLLNEMAKDGHYKPGPKSVSRNTTLERQNYSQQFVATAELDRAPPTKYTRRLVLEKERPPGGGFGDFGGLFGGLP
jgi:Tfp pilus assembly PilM family ATPase